jgi:hypothetical protein
MAQIILYCPEVPGLTLGIGATPAECITFDRGYARFDEAAYPDWRSWIAHPGSPPIEILPSDSDQVEPGTAGAFHCDACGRDFSNKVGWLSHMRTHAPKG